VSVALDDRGVEPGQWREVPMPQSLLAGQTTSIRLTGIAAVVQSSSAPSAVTTSGISRLRVSWFVADAQTS